MANKTWIENDKYLTEGLISDINEAENLDSFIEPANCAWQFPSFRF
jgi:hypothetical protein